MNKALTVSELITKLQTMDPEAPIWVERCGEHRRLEPCDIGQSIGTEDNPNCVYDADEGACPEIVGPLVTITSWS